MIHYHHVAVYAAPHNGCGRFKILLTVRHLQICTCRHSSECISSGVTAVKVEVTLGCYIWLYHTAGSAPEQYKCRTQWNNLQVSIAIFGLCEGPYLHFQRRFSPPANTDTHCRSRHRWVLYAYQRSLVRLFASHGTACRFPLHISGFTCYVRSMSPSLHPQHRPGPSSQDACGLCILVPSTQN